MCGLLDHKAYAREVKWSQEVVFQAAVRQFQHYVRQRAAVTRGIWSPLESRKDVQRFSAEGCGMIEAKERFVLQRGRLYRLRRRQLRRWRGRCRHANLLCPKAR